MSETYYLNERVILTRAMLSKTQIQFSIDLDVTQSLISKIENKHIAATDEIIKKICEIYSISIDWLINGKLPIYISTPIHDQPLEKFLMATYGIKESDAEYVINFLNSDESSRKRLIKFYKLT